MGVANAHIHSQFFARADVKRYTLQGGLQLGAVPQLNILKLHAAGCAGQTCAHTQAHTKTKTDTDTRTDTDTDTHTQTKTQTNISGMCAPPAAKAKETNL